MTPQLDGYYSEYYQRSIEMNKAILKQVFANNTYLLKKAGKSYAQQIADFERMGISLNKHTVKKLRYGGNPSCSLTMLSFIAIYWNYPLDILMAGNIWESGN